MPLDLAAFFSRPDDALAVDAAWPEAHTALLDALERGHVRAAARGDDGTWRAVTWVKRAILLGFRRTELAAMPAAPFPFFDKTAYPPRTLVPADRVRLVPGGSANVFARALGITPKTAGTHVERIYVKIGASTRSTATLFAMQNGLLDTLEPLEPLDL